MNDHSLKKTADSAVSSLPAPSGSSQRVICAKLRASFLQSRVADLAIRVTLIIPGEAPSRLVWTDRHPASVAGSGVLRFKNRAERLDAETFQQLRDERGAKLVTNHRGRITRALGVPIGEPGIEEEQ